jgi:hypothetical protein
MSSAEIQKTKIELINWIGQLSDPDLLTFLSGMKDSNTNGDWYDELSDEQKRHLGEGLNDAIEGRHVSSSEFWRKLNND